MNLRDRLLAALSVLPGKRTFHVHVLTTAPYKHPSIFPYALPRPRVVAHDILVLVSEQPNNDPDAPRVLVAAIEAALYLFPATDTALLYISKVDSTGQGANPSPTAPLVRAFVAWHANPATRPVHARYLWVHLFARAQAQYLFPNSAEHPGKRPLSDVRLCAWWRRILGDATADAAGDGLAARLFYVLPGYCALEAAQALGGADDRWTYGHPYTQTEITLPCPPPPGGVHNLGHVVPSFEDDPKNRFMDELAFTDNVVASPARKRPRLERLADRDREKEKDSEETGGEREREEDRRRGRDEPARPRGELGRITADEFWERMSFRQECVTGAVTGFFVVGFASPAPAAPDDPPPLQPQPGQVPRAMNKRVLKTLSTGVEFSTPERARCATEIVENAVRGLCDGLPSAPPSSAASSAPRPRVDASGSLLPAELVQGGTDAPRTPPRRAQALPSVDDVSPNPFDEPEATRETYDAFIYGSVEVRNDSPPPPLLLREAAAGHAPKKVNVLAVRKKKKATA
ncbi:histone acetylation protein-domain-containing protein [Vararia minispora EC-137]|uniref:Histone acetylation protein-domain-containing protein n=1 Tax=Vararia minispora EC-137 TaxID=1314806 RepID=A0ACB8QXG2_9AGAM|nr:histone acetylation protein-domain-containing protein [Vararia minispora EC-137]